MNKNVSVIVVVIILLGLVGGGFWAYKSLSKPPVQTGTGGETDEVKELSLEERPYTTLVPGPSCEYALSLASIKKSPASIEYEITYKNSEGVLQGATGTFKPAGSSTASKKLLFGSESSGHRRCDPGVSGGTVTLRYRNDDGKLLAKVESKFTIVEDKSSVSVDKLMVDFGKMVKGKVLAMGTMGLPGNTQGKVVEGPYGVFSNSSGSLSGQAKISGLGTLFGWSGSSWEKISGKTSSLSALVLTSP